METKVPDPKNLVVARIPLEKLRKYVDKFFNLEPYGEKPIPSFFNVRTLGKNVFITKDGVGTVTIEIEPDDEAPIDAVPEFVTQALDQETSSELYNYIVERIQLYNQDLAQQKPFTGADFNF